MIELVNCVFFALHLSLAGNSDRLTWVRLQQQQEQRYPFLTVREVLLCVRTKEELPMVWIFNVRTDVNSCDCTRGCADTVTESALKVDSGRKIPRRTGEWNLFQWRAGPTLYQLSYILCHDAAIHHKTLSCDSGTKHTIAMETDKL